MRKLEGVLTAVHPNGLAEIVAENSLTYGCFVEDLPAGFCIGDQVVFEPMQVAFSRQAMAFEIEKLNNEVD